MLNQKLHNQNTIIKMKNLDSKVSMLQERLINIENAIQGSPVKSLATHALRTDINMLTEKVKSQTENLQIVSTSNNDIFKWFITFAASLVLGIGASFGVSHRNKTHNQENIYEKS
jgi:hypothetical protein